MDLYAFNSRIVYSDSVMILKKISTVWMMHYQIILKLIYNKQKTDCMNKTKLYSAGNSHLFIKYFRSITM
jgi:hypothetical protein